MIIRTQNDDSLDAFLAALFELFEHDIAGISQDGHIDFALDICNLAICLNTPHRFQSATYRIDRPLIGLADEIAKDSRPNGLRIFGGPDHGDPFRIEQGIQILN